MVTILAFVVALGLLITVHEYGHYRVAVACGVKVLRFSVGFGKTIFKWQPKGSKTEFVLGLLPLGGFVKMLDEREGPVAADEKHLAFNNQSLSKRAAIVVAGPVANLLLAIFLYSMVNWVGVQEPKAILASPTVGSIAQRAGIVGGEYVLQASFKGDELEDIRSLEDLRWLLTRGALNAHDVRVLVAKSPEAPKRELLLELTQLDVTEVDAQLFQKIGITGPWTQALIDGLQADGAAKRAGLQSGDIVLAVDDVAIVDGQQLRQLIRTSIKSKQIDTASKNEATNSLSPQTWAIDRHGQQLKVMVQPDLKIENGFQVGKIGAFVGAAPQFTTVSYGFFDGLYKGTLKTWEFSVLSLRMMGKMVLGQASLKNLSGPLTIAEYAGKSATMGLSVYLSFLAFISVSLGVLNLLPLPVLDGGHLMYYLWEGVTGKAVADAWMERLQRGGVALLFGMMVIALYNDITRLFVNG